MLLSGSLGLGHEMLVRSCAALLGRSGWDVSSLDCMELLGRRLGAVGQRMFTKMVGAAPALYDGLHFAHLRAGSPLAERMGRSATARLVPAVREVVDAEAPELLLSVFATGAWAAAALKRAGATDARTVVLCTDVTLHRLWVDEGTDLFLATSPAAAASVRRYLPRANVAVVPRPVRAVFYDAPSQLQARAELGLPADARCVLLIDSGWGFGPLGAGVAAMAAAGIEVLAVAGRRREVEGRLRALAARDRRIHPFGFVEDVPRLMAAADVVVALPGATTCSEARVVGRPLLLLDVMPGHGRENVLHELEVGDALVCGTATADMVASIEVLLDLRAEQGPERPAASRWEPAFAAALRSIGVDVASAESAPSDPAHAGAQHQADGAGRAPPRRPRREVGGAADHRAAPTPVMVGAGSPPEERHERGAGAS